MDRSNPSAAERVSEVSAALVPRTAELASDICQLIVREIPQLRGDKRVLTLLDASVAENVSTMLHVLQHCIELENVGAPAAAEEYARRLAQHGVPVAALLRAYRLGSGRFEEWCVTELGRRTDSAEIVSVSGMRIAGTLNTYIDRVSEAVVSAYELEKEKWLRNQSAARAARVRALLRNEQPDVDASEAILGYRLRQHHLGVVTWITGPPGGGGTLGLLERATTEVAAQAGCDGRLMFVPQDEPSAWAWLPLGGRRDVALSDVNVKSIAGGDRIQFAFGEPALGVVGFRRSHQQALSAQAVALAAGPATPPVTSFAEVAPLALMSGSLELLRAWVAETLGPLADDDDHNARLRDTLRVFLQENGSYKVTAERLVLHKNTVQYRVRKAEESPAPSDRPGSPAYRTRPAGRPVARPGRAAPGRRAAQGPGVMTGVHDQVSTVTVGQQRLRIAIRPGTGDGPPLLLCNGIGAPLEVFEPFTGTLDPAVEVVRFDVPGVGGSPVPRLPYPFPRLARLAGRMLAQLGYDQFDALGVSWGGGLAQQLAFQNPRRCRRLVLVSTATGSLMVPATPRVLLRMSTAHRHRDPAHARRIAGDIYGGALRAQPELADQLSRAYAQPVSSRGYLYQLAAGTGWTSLPFLPLIRQPTLILAGDDDPIIPLINARLMAALLPAARLHVYPDGHLGLLTRARELAPIVGDFLLSRPAPG